MFKGKYLDLALESDQAGPPTAVQMMRTVNFKFCQTL